MFRWQRDFAAQRLSIGIDTRVHIPSLLYSSIALEHFWVGRGALDGHDTVLDGEVDEFGTAMEAMGLHDLVFVKFDRPGRDCERRGNLLGRMAFSQELQDFPLARGQ